MAKEGLCNSKSNISVCMIARNEEKTIADAIRSVLPVAKEIIVVDTGSTDGTMDILEKFDVRKERFKWNNNFSEARNRSLALAGSEWILVIDADEVISEKDHAKILDCTKNDFYHGYTLQQRTYESKPCEMWCLNDRLYEESSNYPGYCITKPVRLFRNNKSIRYRGRIHETVIESITDKSRITDSNIVIHHYGHILDPEKLKNKKRQYLNLCIEKCKDNPTDSKALFELGRLYFELEEHDKAIVEFKKAVLLDPENNWYFADLGFALLKKGDIKEAEKALLKSIEYGGKVAEVFSVLGLIRFKLGKKEDAENFLKEALKLDPEHIGALNNYGLVCYSTGRIEKAAYIYKKITSIAPWEFNSLGALGMCYEKLDEIEKAINIYKIFLGKFPEKAKFVAVRLIELESRMSVKPDSYTLDSGNESLKHISSGDICKAAGERRIK